MLGGDEAAECTRFVKEHKGWVGALAKVRCNRTFPTLVQIDIFRRGSKLR